MKTATVAMNRLTAEARTPPAPVIVVGPPRDAIGGMATVVNQLAGFTFGNRYRVEPFAVTLSETEAEPFLSRARRHLAQGRRLATVIRRTGAEIVHVHTCSGFSFLRSALDLRVAARMGCRTVLHVHGGAFDQFHAQSSYFTRGFIGRVLAKADRTIALSAWWRDELKRMSPRADVVVIENAVSIPDTLGERRHGGPCRFLLLARMDDWKGIDDLLAAAGQLRSAGLQFELTLAGPPGSAGDEGILAAKIARQALTGIVHYVGPVLGPAKEELLRAADVYVQPSHHEGMPVSLLEAMALGLPVIATKVGAVAEMVTPEGDGVLVPPRAPDQLAAAMMRLCADPTMRNTLGAKGRDTIQRRFGLPRLEADILALYDSLRADEVRSASRSDRAEIQPTLPASTRLASI